jgi:hypothetical protein
MAQHAENVGSFQRMLTALGRLVRWLVFGEFKLWALSLFLVGFGLYELARQELSMLAWKKTRGVVVSSETRSLERDRDRFGPSFTVDVRYRYTVDGRDYSSDRFTTGNPRLFYWVQEAAEFRKRFPPGKEVEVLYAPYDPAQATLFAERSSGPWISLGLGVPLLLLTAYVHLRRVRRREEVDPVPDIPIPWS